MSFLFGKKNKQQQQQQQPLARDAGAPPPNNAAAAAHQARDRDRYGPGSIPAGAGGGGGGGGGGSGGGSSLGNSVNSYGTSSPDQARTGGRQEAEPGVRIESTPMEAEKSSAPCWDGGS